MPSAFFLQVAVRSVCVVIAIVWGTVAGGQGLVWLRGTGDELEIKLRGEVFNTDGSPATKVDVAGTINATAQTVPLEAKIDGHSFEVWVPLNRLDWHSLWLRASAVDANPAAYKILNRYELRQAAIEGVKLSLQVPQHRISVKVTDGGKPVPEASVKASLGFDIDLWTTTDTEGIAHFDLLPGQELSSLTAWTEEPRIGGFQFSRSPPRDPKANEHEIELNKCRDQKLRFIGEDGSPVAGLRFELYVATPPPHYNYLGMPTPSELKTNEAGEAVCRWFPDWEEIYFYATPKDAGWYVEGEPTLTDGVAIFKLKKNGPRKRITGQVVSAGTSTSSGGFYVHFRSFQGEREHHYSDLDSAFTNADGTFAVNVLPDATYCAYVQDAKWVGKTIDVLPYDSSVDRFTEPVLEITEGQPVEIMVTSGPHKEPVANQSVHLRRDHRYSWLENGETRHGVGGPQWWATTDASGRATTQTLPGKLTASIYSPRWRTEQSIDVIAGEPAKISLHREIDEKRAVVGRVVLDDAAHQGGDDIEVRVGSVDPNYEDEQSITCKADGSFSFDTFAGEVAIFAGTKNGELAGAIVTKKFGSPVEIRLRPTLIYHGQLLGVGDQPVVSHPVRTIVSLYGERVPGARFPHRFEVARLETKTDNEGNYTFRGLPCQIKASIYADSLGGGDDSIYVGEILLEPNELRPRAVSNLATKAAAAVQLPLAERYKTTFRDCKLAGYRPLVIIADDTGSADSFINRNYANYEVNKDVYSFMPIIVTGGKKPLAAADEAFLKEYEWPLPEIGRVVAIVLDADGSELGRQVLDLNETSAADEATKFIHQYAPAQQDAEVKWSEAFAEAARTNRRVWVRISQRYCGPCFRLTRWLDDQHPLLEKDYVVVKIDDVRDLHGSDVATRITRGQRHGVPFHAIFDASGTMLIDSAGPLGNIGYPSGTEGKRHLQKMLMETRQTLTDTEVEQLVESVDRL